jgi:hypothetical protein
VEIVPIFAVYVLILAWAIEVVRRLGQHTKLLTRIADDIAALRAESRSDEG